MWKQLLYKVMAIFDLVSYQEKVRSFLGEKVYKSLLPKEVVMEEVSVRNSFGLPFYRVMGTR